MGCQVRNHFVFFFLFSFLFLLLLRRIRIFTQDLEKVAVIEHHSDVINVIRIVAIEDVSLLFAASKDGTVSVWSLSENLPSFYNKFDSIY